MDSSTNPPPSRRGIWALGLLAVSGLFLATAAWLALRGEGPRALAIGELTDPLTKAKLAMAEGDLPRSEALLREILKGRPQDREARLLLGKVLLRRGRLGAARETFQAILKEEKDHPAAVRGMAEVMEASGQPDLAVVWWQRAAALQKQDPEPHLRIAALLARKGDLAGALGALHQARAIDPEREDTEALLQEILTRQTQAGVLPGGSRPGAVFPPRPQPPDPRALVPVPQPPDPTRHLPRSGGGNP